MSIDKLAINRRSRRAYKDKLVKVQHLGQILDIARYAPSAGNLQNWRFIVVTDRKIKNEIAEACLKQYWMNKSPVLIVIAGDLEKAQRLYYSKAESYTTQSCSNSAMLMLLKAQELGLSACWVGSFDANAVQRILKIPGHIKPYIIITLGYSSEKPYKKKMEPLSVITSFDKYNNKIKEFEKESIKSKIRTLKNMVFEKKDS